MLEREEVNNLLRLAKDGDEKAKETLLVHNSPLLKSIVKKFSNKGVEYDDLYQIACIGFLKSIKNFDESFNVKFSTYTVPMVVGEIKRYMRDNGAIKVSRTLKILAVKINSFIEKYKNEKGESPSLEKIANDLNVDIDEVVLALDSSRMPISLSEKDEDGDDKTPELIDRIPSKYREEEMIDKIMLKGIIKDLSERERLIITLRFYRDRTQSEIAEELGVSQVQVSRLETKIIDKMRLKF